MKKVILPSQAPTDTVLLNVVSIAYYYGVIPSNKETKGFITREIYGEGRFNARCMDFLTNAGGWDIYAGSIKELIRKLITMNFEVYQFETEQELLKWLARPLSTD